MKRVAEETGDVELLKTANAITKAAANDKLVYLHASQKIGDEGSNAPDLNITKFDVPGKK
ncbi:MAG: hypothetical protein RLZZ519_3470 [Bacteroidota bacterium]